MNNPTERINFLEDGISHINTHSKTKSRLGSILSPSYDVGQPIHHPLLGHFRTVENAWWYLNTGGYRDKIRTMEPSKARLIAKLSESYQCDKFKELIRDMTILKLDANPHWRIMVIENELPFEHYYVKGKGDDRIMIRPSYSQMYVDILNDVTAICRGEMHHEWVRFRDMNFTKRDLK